MAVPVGVFVEGREHAVVDAAVAVVVESVADLGQPRAHARTRVVAVGPAAPSARAVDVAAGRVGLAVPVEIAHAERGGVTVFVDVVGVTDLAVAGEARGVVVVAVRAAAGNRVEAVLVRVGWAHAAAGARAGGLVAFARARRGAGEAALRVGGAGVRLARLDAVAEEPVVALGRALTHARRARVHRRVAAARVHGDRLITRGREPHDQREKQLYRLRAIDLHGTPSAGVYLSASRPRLGQRPSLAA